MHRENHFCSFRFEGLHLNDFKNSCVKRSLLILFSSMLLVVLAGVISLQSTIFKTKTFEFDKTTTVEQFEKLKGDMMENGVVMDVKFLEYNSKGFINQIEVSLKYTGSETSFGTQMFESVCIEKRLFGMRVAVKESKDN